MFMLSVCCWEFDMHISDYLLLGAIVLAVLAAVQHMRKHKDGCCGSCHTDCRNCQARKDQVKDEA